KMIVILTLCGLPIFLIIFLFGDNIFMLLFGEEWALSGSIASYLSIWLFANYVGAPIVNTYLVFNKQKTAFRFSVFQNCLLAFGLILGTYFNLEFFNFIIVFVVISTFNNLLFYLWIVRLIYTAENKKS